MPPVRWQRIGKANPPIRNADYFRQSIHRTVWIIRHGQNGLITVNDLEYNQKMPGNPQLKPLDIARITTYLYNIWGMSKGVIPASEVEKYLQTSPENY